MADFLMRPKIDYAFKEIMMDEQARIGFLSAVLKLNPADVRKTELLNTNLRKHPGFRSVQRGSRILLLFPYPGRLKAHPLHRQNGIPRPGAPKTAAGVKGRQQRHPAVGSVY